MKSNLEGQSTASNSLTESSMQQSRIKSHRIGHKRSKRKSVQVYLSIKTKNKPIRTNSTITAVIFTGVWCDRIVAKYQGYHSTDPADKQINEQMAHPTSPLNYYWIVLLTQQLYTVKWSEVDKNSLSLKSHRYLYMQHKTEFKQSLQTR